MKSKVVYFILLAVGLIIAAVLLSPRPDSATPDAAGGCTVAEYRAAASPLVQELSDITDRVDLADADSRRDGRSDITAVVVKINRLDCGDDFPLKHETLLFTATYFRDALTAVDAGDATAASQALDLAAVNAARFNNWSVDID